MDPSRAQEMMGLFGEFRAAQEAAGLLDSESKRHSDNLDLFEAMIREAYDGVTMVVAGHHIMVMRAGHPLPIEIPSADYLIFNHTIANAVWKGRAMAVLTMLANEPVETRDALLRSLYYGRGA